MRSRPAAEAIGVFLLASVTAVFLTYPLAFKLGHVGRLELGDGQWSIWVINWVARTLVADPRHVFDANIFYPHKNTLAFSESNLGGGLLGVPVYWLTRNPYTTHNFVLLASLVLAAVGMYYLCRRLTGHRGAAAVAAITFAFSPYTFGRTAHIQLLLTAGLPFCMLAFHRLLERPTPTRGLVLALAFLLQAISCGYYGVFAALMVSAGVPFFALSRGLWRNPRFWTAVATASGIAIALGIVFYLPYLELRHESGFERTLNESRSYSADWRAYFASNAWAHRWMLPLLKHWNEVLFPGFIATTLGMAGAGLAFKRRLVFPRDTIVFYVLLLALALWASFGPAAGLYTLLYRTVPIFSFLRAPARIGVVVVFSLSVLTSFTVASWMRRDQSSGVSRRPELTEGRGRHWMAAALALAAVAELAAIPIRWREAPPLRSPYRMLATLPRGAVVELPFFYLRPYFSQHSLYMLYSTYHWQPLVNGYSDYIPKDFRDMVIVVSSFPARDSFKALEPIAPRYVVFHMDMFDHRLRPRLEARIQEFSPYLRLLTRDGDVWLYEIVGWPP